MDQHFSSASIGYLSPGWPLNAFPNGIVSYVADMADQMKKMGHQITIVAGDVVGKTRDSTVYNMQSAPEVDGRCSAVPDRISYRIAPGWARDRIYNRRFVAMIQRAVAEQGIQIFEMEESFGRACLVRMCT